MDSQRLQKGQLSRTSAIWLVVILNHGYNGCIDLNYAIITHTHITIILEGGCMGRSGGSQEDGHI
jgi:hypothetical protein